MLLVQKRLPEQLLDQSFEQLLKTSASGPAVLGDGSATSGDSTSGMDNFSDVSGMLADTPENLRTKIL